MKLYSTIPKREVTLSEITKHIAHERYNVFHSQIRLQAYQILQVLDRKCQQQTAVLILLYMTSEERDKRRGRELSLCGERYKGTDIILGALRTKLTSALFGTVVR